MAPVCSPCGPGGPDAAARARIPRVAGSGSVFGVLDSLADPPEHTRRIIHCEVTNAPGSIAWRNDTHSILLAELLRADVSPPCFHVFHQQVHHETLRMLPHVEPLEQKARPAGVEVRKIVG